MKIGIEMKHNPLNVLMFAGSLWVAGSAGAEMTAFTDRARFEDALQPGWVVSTLDFDRIAPGTLIDSGKALDGLAFTYDFGWMSMMVSNAYTTTSSTNFLGTDGEAEAFLDGDEFRLDFAPQHAVGMYFISADVLQNDDIRLLAGNGSASLVARDVQQTLADGSHVFFLGLINPGAAFTTASVTNLGQGAFFYNVDDITIAAVPEPESWAMLLAGAGLVGAVSWRRNLNHRPHRLNGSLRQERGLEKV